jgi:hypothetical protein
MLGESWYLLILDDKREPNADARPVARATSAAALEQLLTRERVEPYWDRQWRKVFRRGGPLEWKDDPGQDRAKGIAEVFAVAAREGVVLLAARALMQIPTVQELEQMLPDTAGGEVPK